MGRVVFITQSYLSRSTIVGVTRDWVRALANRSDGVDVIALDGEPERDDARVRVHSLGKSRGRGRVALLATFYAALARALPAASAVFVHMVPRYVLLAAPLALAARRPMTLWYAQGGVSQALGASVRLLRHIVTPTRDSFPLAGAAVEARLRVTGHGVDVTRYAPSDGIDAERGRVLAAGRLSASKRYEVLVDALSQVRSAPWRLRIASGGGYAASEDYARAFLARIELLGISERVSLLGEVSYEALPVEYRAAWLLGHTSATGSLDKVVLEAMACGTPVVSTAPSSRALLAPIDEALAPTDAAPARLAASLSDVLAWNEPRRAEAGRALRAVVERSHSLTRWADQVAALLAS
ncbi:MAG: glycosyltransferase family 4 protein [Chloroflexota bacterium]